MSSTRAMNMRPSWNRRMSCSRMRLRRAARSTAGAMWKSMKARRVAESLRPRFHQAWTCWRCGRHQ
eukprot:9726302-Lingulodinium_polyedra.AAC.1